ncbi:NUDIX domain-containing protein [Candidatus Woesearchaeota archaeon]|nr:NUDIX domain-containing protein [Candidatus Woesearchaeota archaeon]
MYDRSKMHYIVVTGIIVKDNRYLIAKRSSKEKVMPNLWTVPGGRLELKDYIYRHKDTNLHWYNVFEDLLRREVREETGLEIKNIGYVTSMVFFRPDGVPTVVVSLSADHHNGEVLLSDELTDHKWVTLEQAKAYDLIEGIYEELEILDKMLKGGNMESWKKI